MHSTWAILEGQIAIVIEATSQENNRRDRRPLRVGRHESRDFFSRQLAQVTLQLPSKLPKARTKNAQCDQIDATIGSSDVASRARCLSAAA
jgi:hypothetical protein